MKSKKITPIHPGIMLKEDLVIEKKISQVQLAKILIYQPNKLKKYA
jgi:plasmid maintenance system antidote protein VapI